MKPITYIFETLAKGDAFLGWLVIVLAVGCFGLGSWLWLDSLEYMRRRRRAERLEQMRSLQMQIDEARHRARLPRAEYGDAGKI